MGFKIKKTEVADFVDETRQCLIDGGWTKGSYGPDSICEAGVLHCMVGAAMFVRNERNRKAGRRLKKADGLYERALRAIVRQISKTQKLAGRNHKQYVSRDLDLDEVIISVNDHNATTAKEVLGLLKKTSKTLRAEAEEQLQNA